MGSEVNASVGGHNGTGVFFPADFCTLIARSSTAGSRARPKTKSKKTATSPHGPSTNSTCRGTMLPSSSPASQSSSNSKRSCSSPCSSTTAVSWDTAFAWDPCSPLCWDNELAMMSHGMGMDVAPCKAPAGKPQAQSGACHSHSAGLSVQGIARNLQAYKPVPALDLQHQQLAHNPQEQLPPHGVASVAAAPNRMEHSAALIADSSTTVCGFPLPATPMPSTADCRAGATSPSWTTAVQTSLQLDAAGVHPGYFAGLVSFDRGDTGQLLECPSSLQSPNSQQLQLRLLAQVQHPDLLTVSAQQPADAPGAQLVFRDMLLVTPLQSATNMDVGVAGQARLPRTSVDSSNNALAPNMTTAVPLAVTLDTVGGTPLSMRGMCLDGGLQQGWPQELTAAAWSEALPDADASVLMQDLGAAAAAAPPPASTDDPFNALSALVDAEILRLLALRQEIALCESSGSVSSLADAGSRSAMF